MPFKKQLMLVSICPKSLFRYNRCLIDCGWIFAQHFCNRLGPAYLQLKNVLDENDPTHAEVLNNIKRRFREETFTRESIAQVIHAYPELVRLDSPNLNAVFNSILFTDPAIVCQLCDDTLPDRRQF